MPLFQVDPNTSGATRHGQGFTQEIDSVPEVDAAVVKSDDFELTKSTFASVPSTDIKEFFLTKSCRKPSLFHATIRKGTSTSTLEDTQLLLISTFHVQLQPT